MNYDNDNTSDIATNLFKPVKVIKSHWYNQKFRNRTLTRLDKWMTNPTPSNYRFLQQALVDYAKYFNESLIHPLDIED